MHTYHPKADSRAMVVGEHYRFTVLTGRMVRLEYSPKGAFVDAASQTVMNREFPVPEFRVIETADSLEIIAEGFRLNYNKQPFSPDGLSITSLNPFAMFQPLWHYGEHAMDLGPMKGNLGGTARTLDTVNGECELEEGLMSMVGGWSTLDDSHTLLMDETGWVAHREDPDAVDMYFFSYGRAYFDCLRDYYTLTGATPLLPRYALGNWWSRYYKYTEQSYNALMDRFERENVPLSVAVIDMDWHLTSVPEDPYLWTAYTWNKDYFPDPERFLRGLHERNMKTTLNVHPADGIRYFDDSYEAMADYMGVDAEKKDPVKFEIGNPKFLKGYLDLIHHPFEEQGVDFWWIDWQQGTRSGVAGLDPLWMLNHYHYLDSKRDGKRGMILSRYAGPGSHRYPLGFSGDTVITWESLAFQPKFTATASNIGYGWWSHDIGGHMLGYKDDELAARWMQLGVFSPINRLHSSNNEFNGKEPWRYNRIAGDVMKKFLRLRHRMIPYLYTMNVEAAKGVPLILPMYYRNPEAFDSFFVPNEYYFGSQLIACPITEPMEKASGMAKVTAWLPEGKYVDFFTGLVYEGGRKLDLYRSLENFPLLAPAGSIIPLDGRTEGNSLTLPETLELRVAVGADGSFTLLEDDESAAELEDVRFASTKMVYTHGETAKLTIYPAEGAADILPQSRTYTVVFMGLSEAAEITAVSEDTELPIQVSFDASTGFTTVSLSAVSVRSGVTVTVKNAGFHDNQKAERIFDYLNQAQIVFDEKSAVYGLSQKALGASNPAYALAEILQLGIRPEVTGPVAEILTSNI